MLSTAPGMCFMNYVLKTFLSSHCPFSPRIQNNDCLLCFSESYLTFTALLQKNIPLFSLQLCSLLLWYQKLPNLLFLLTTLNVNLEHGGLLKAEKLVRERSKVFASAHRNDKEHQAMICLLLPRQ